MINRVKRKTVPFSEEQFFLIEAREGFYQFIDRETLNVISCSNFSEIQTYIKNVLTKYKSYDILSRKIKHLEFYIMTEQEKEQKRLECQRKGEHLSYILDEIISEYYKSLDTKEDAKKSRRKLVKKSISTATEEYKKPEALKEPFTPAVSTRTLKRRPKRI